MKKIILTGGGTAGHVTPNIALLPKLKEAGYEVSYIGSYEGIERKLIEDEGIKYYGISSGKLRRYLDIKNFSDPFKVLKGYAEARKLIKSIKPDIVFSKGGFVSVPVVFAAKDCKVPVIIHESDMTPGLANKLSIPKAAKVCCNFPETMKYLPEGKAVLSGSPIREHILNGDKSKGLEFLGFNDDKPVILIMGGSIGSVFINNAVRGALDILLDKYQVVHLVGKGNLDHSYDNRTGYRQFEFISDQLPDLFACCNLMISRAGANAICEILALKIPNILIPLSAEASRGDQILNAESFKKQGFSMVMQEEEVTVETLTDNINWLYDNKEKYIDKMSESGQMDAVSTIIDLIKENSLAK